MCNVLAEAVHSLARFRNVPDEYHWKGACLLQIDRFEELAVVIESSPLVFGTHRSKSIELPVVAFHLPNLILMLRDNFYDINLWVRSVLPIELEYSQLFPELDMAWYRGEINRMRNYTYNGWTDAQMEDPTVLRYGDDDAFPRSEDEKMRWIKRMSSAEWYGHDWSSGHLIAERPEGNAESEPFADETKFYMAHTCFAEGMGDSARNAPLYEKGSKNFIVCVPTWDKIHQIIPLLLNTASLQPQN